MPMRGHNYYSEVTANGRITLPAELRQLLGMVPGDLVEVRASETGDSRVIEVRRCDSLIEATAGIARPKVPYTPPEWHEVERIVKEEIGRRVYEETDQ
ncbi:MAG: AbrB/MazE/SpoVT family DNA-binding domain-containing protein [Chloroflexi bacterium]|nr:AbrB/MazE/SpoVT family DNA-binding domain-containing protein [Chloroflexota bacterium]